MAFNIEGLFLFIISPHFSVRTTRQEKILYKIFEFNKFAYLCLPQKLRDNVCFVMFFEQSKIISCQKVSLAKA
jgi:hypothetical protein